MFVFALISALLVLCAISYSFSLCKRPVFTALKSAVSGFSALLLINLTSFYTGCYIPINPRTGFVSTVLSLPGILGLLVMKLVFNY